MLPMRRLEIQETTCNKPASVQADLQLAPLTCPLTLSIEVQLPATATLWRQHTKEYAAQLPQQPLVRCAQSRKPASVPRG